MVPLCEVSPFSGVTHLGLGKKLLTEVSSFQVSGLEGFHCTTCKTLCLREDTVCVCMLVVYCWHQYSVK